MKKSRHGTITQDNPAWDNLGQSRQIYRFEIKKIRVAWVAACIAQRSVESDFSLLCLRPDRFLLRCPTKKPSRRDQLVFPLHKNSKPNQFLVCRCRKPRPPTRFLLQWSLSDPPTRRCCSTYSCPSRHAARLSRCYFMLRDVSRLEVAGARLNKARLGFELSHGKDSMRFRLLQAARHADLALYVRLELLEGVVAYYNGHTEKARGSLSSAQSKYMQLQVPDEAITMLMDMGYDARASKRALKMTGYDIQSSVDPLCEEREKKIRRREQDIETQREIMEQRRYGRTPMNKEVDMQKLKGLTSIGFEKYLAAEALRINENDAEKALDLLTNPELNCALQTKIQSRRKRPSHVLGAGPLRAGAAAGAVATPAAANAPPPIPDLNATEGGNQEQLVNNEEAANKDTEAGTNEEAMNQDQDMGDEAEEDMIEEEAGASDAQAPSRDVVMENELANELTGDALDDYDIDVANEGQAIADYLSLLESAATIIRPRRLALQSHRC